MNDEIQQIKALLLQAQKKVTPKDNIIHRVVEGDLELLSATQIAKRLDITEETLFEWVRNTDPHFYDRSETMALDLKKIPHKSNSLVNDRLMDLLNSYKTKKVQFPLPDIYVGEQPRWTKVTLRNWLKKENSR